MTMIVGLRARRTREGSTPSGGDACPLVGRRPRRRARSSRPPWIPGWPGRRRVPRVPRPGRADQALDRARANLPADVRRTFVRHSARSAPAGLLELAEAARRELIVLGSSSAGVFGHVALGSVPTGWCTARRLGRPGHAGISGQARAKVRGSRRPSAAARAPSLVLAAAGVAAGVGASLRIATFAVWSRPAFTTRLGTEPEDLVMQEWRAELRAAPVGPDAGEGPARAAHATDAVVGSGVSWAERSRRRLGRATLLVVGSSGRPSRGCSWDPGREDPAVFAGARVVVPRAATTAGSPTVPGRTEGSSRRRPAPAGRTRSPGAPRPARAVGDEHDGDATRSVVVVRHRVAVRAGRGTPTRSPTRGSAIATPSTRTSPLSQ